MTSWLKEKKLNALLGNDGEEAWNWRITNLLGTFAGSQDILKMSWIVNTPSPFSQAASRWGPCTEECHLKVLV
jgi:hypothetical protein